MTATQTAHGFLVAAFRAEFCFVVQQVRHTAGAKVVVGAALAVTAVRAERFRAALKLFPTAVAGEFPAIGAEAVFGERGLRACGATECLAVAEGAFCEFARQEFCLAFGTADFFLARACSTAVPVVAEPVFADMTENVVVRAVAILAEMDAFGFKRLFTAATATRLRLGHRNPPL